jgi:hypothetical protein
MMGHARFGLDGLSNREKSKLVHLSSLKNSRAERRCRLCPLAFAEATPLSILRISCQASAEHF